MTTVSPVPSAVSPAPSFLARHRDLLIVLGAALGLRLLFALLIADTYDYDEFVILLLARDLAHGDVLYRDFMFFHPPGALVLFRLIEPLTALWWPLARLFCLAADTVTAVLVWRIACDLYDRRTALAAGLLYAASPLALISAVRVDQDPLITVLGISGLALLRLRPGWQSTVLAGISLGVAVWLKYPALYFVPVFVLAAPRRAAVVIAVGAAVFAALMLPFHAEFSQLYFQTITFQRNRWLMLPDARVATIAIYWLLVNVLGVIGLLRRPRLWAAAGFLVGGAFILTPQVYYHYFVPVVPFGALLGAPVAVRFFPSSVRLVTAAILLLTLGCAALIDLGGPSPLYVTAAHLSTIQPAISLVDRTTLRTQPLLGDRYEYAYLADRPALAHYFWNVGVLVNAAYLERRVGKAGAVVLSFGASSGYPRGFDAYLDRRYPHIDTAANRVWLVHQPFPHR